MPLPRVWQGLIESLALSGRRHFMQTDPSAVPRCDIVEKDAWAELRMVKGFDQTPSWYSPGGAQSGEGSSCAAAKGGVPMRRSENMFVRDTTGNQLGGRWFFPSGRSVAS